MIPNVLMSASTKRHTFNLFATLQRSNNALCNARILMQAVDANKGVKRFFHIFTYPTLAEGIWAIKVINGHIGRRGSMRHYHFTDTDELQTKLRLILRKRLNATHRIGVNYQIIGTSLPYTLIDKLVAKKVKTAQRKKGQRPQVKSSATDHVSSFEMAESSRDAFTTPRASLTEISATSPHVQRPTIQAQPIPPQSRTYSWQDNVPIWTPLPRLRYEMSPEERQQKRQDTIASLNKRMGQNTIVTASDPLKSHWK